MYKLLIICLTLLFVGCGQEEPQKADVDYQPNIDDPVFASGTGPVVLIDEGHNNYHTIEGRYQAFAEVLRLDGYVVGAHKGKFTPESLNRGDILVISNAMPDGVGEESFTTYPSAFSENEINAVAGWVENGGSLFLIADHMPFPSAAADLAERFGFKFNNGFAIDTIKSGPTVFNRNDNTLHAHPITDGLADNEFIDSVASFTGQAFTVIIEVDPILTMPLSTGNYVPEEGLEFDRKKMTCEPVGGHLQGAVCKYGQGRLAVFGEAAMFTSQTYEGVHRFGLSHPEAQQNLRFLRNLMRWLADKQPISQ